MLDPQERASRIRLNTELHVEEEEEEEVEEVEEVEEEEVEEVMFGGGV